MAHRSVNKKRANKLRRLMVHRDPPIAYIDLVQWLQDHGHAQTSGEAREKIELGLVMADSHPLGMKEVYEAPHQDSLKTPPKMRLSGRPLVPAGLRGRIRVKDVPGA
jgi:hypothetical protein